MTGTEDRLARALRARTDLITHDQLRPAVPPAAVHRLPWRRTAAYASLAAAACAAVAVLPFLLADGDKGEGPGPVTTQTPSGDGADWPVVEERKADLDGDGDLERVVLRREEAAPQRGRVELPDEAGAPYVIVAGPRVAGFLGNIDIDQGKPGGQVTVSRREQDGKVSIDVLAWVDGELAVATPTTGDSDLPALTTVPDDQGRAREFWIQEAALLSSRSVDPNPDYDSPDPAVRVQIWVWELQDGKLAPQDGGTWCHDGNTPPKPCASEDGPNGPDGPGGTDGFEDGASPFADPATDVIGIGEDFFTNLDGDRGGDDQVRLTRAGDSARLEASFDDGTSTHIDLTPPHGAADNLAPTVHTTYLAARTPMLVVRWGGTEGITQVYDPSGHELRLLSFTSVFGGNQDEEGGIVWSVLTEDGSFYALHRSGEEAVDVFRWDVSYDGGAAIHLVLGNEGKAIGRWCADGPEGAGWVTCT